MQVPEEYGLAAQHLPLRPLQKGRRANALVYFCTETNRRMVPTHAGWNSHWIKWDAYCVSPEFILTGERHTWEILCVIFPSTAPNQSPLSTHRPCLGLQINSGPTAVVALWSNPHSRPKGTVAFWAQGSGYAAFCASYFARGTGAKTKYHPPTPA